MRRAAGVAAAVAAFAVACGGPRNDIDPFPIDVDLTTGAVVAAADTGGAAFPVAVDTMSPITVLDPSATGTAAGASERRVVDITLHAVTATGTVSVARARFPAVTSYQLSPCGAGSCAVGTDAAAHAIGGVIGADALERSAVRFDFATQTMRMFPDVAGTSKVWAKQCDAVLSAPFSGGGTLEVGGTEVTFARLRPIVGACADFSPAMTADARGVDLLLVLSTAVGPTVISDSAYARYRAFVGQAAAPALSDLPTGTVMFSSGPASVHVGHLDRLSLVGDVSNQRGPCTEVYANRVMRADACDAAKSTITCPCKNGDKFCPTAAAVDLAPPSNSRAAEVAILPDASPILEGLRDELSPNQSDVDGILGTWALEAVRVSLDYPHDRIILHCVDASGCVASPAITDRSQRKDVLGCPKPPGPSLP